jgi:hypothetical protein
VWVPPPAAPLAADDAEKVGPEVVAVVACDLRAARWQPAGAHLAARRGEPSFATVRDAEQVRLVMYAGHAADASVQLDVGGAIVRGHVRADEVTLHPARPFVVEDALVPTSRTPLRWLRAREGHVTVELRPSEELVLEHPRRELERACEDLTVDVAYFDPTPLVGARGAPTFATLRAGSQVPVQRSPDGGFVGMLEPRRDYPILLFETVVDQTRFMVWLGDELVFGWVPQGSVDSYRNASVHPYLELPGAPDASDTVTLCTDAPLQVQMKDRREYVGYVKHGSPIRVGEVHADLVEVELDRARLDLDPGAKLLIATQHLLPCAR